MPDLTLDLDRRLQLAHQSRRASEHLLDGIRRAMCDAGFMRDDDPYGHADLADVIRQAGEAGAEDAVRQLARAIRLTREYVGPELLPAVAGWDWYDALRKWAPEQLPQPPTAAEPAPVLAPCAIDHDCPSQLHPGALTARGEARCQSLYRPEGEPLVQCARAVHPKGTQHADHIPELTPTLAGPGDVTRCVWRDEDEAAHRG